MAPEPDPRLLDECLMHQKMNSHVECTLSLKVSPLEYATVDIESTIGPGGIIAAAWIKSFAAIYVFEGSIFRAQLVLR